MSIRLRLAAVFTIAAAALYALGSWLFITELSFSLLRAIDAQLAVQLGAASRYLPAPGRPAPAPAPTSPGEYVIQVIDPSGRVRGASSDDGRTLLLPAADLSQARRHSITLTVAREDERQRVIAGPLTPRLAGTGWVAVAGVDLESYDNTLGDVTRGLIIGGLVLVTGAGAGAYRLARAALAPVERLRREVAALSERDQAPGVQVPRTRDEIAALAATMNDLLARLHRALSRQRALVADASHELRSPLAVLGGELELAAQPGRSRDELRDAVSRAGEETARLARLTEQLLFLARSDEDRLSPHRQPVNVRLLLGRSAEQAGARAREAGVRCEVAAPAGLTADLDQDRIREAIDNLLDNALRFAPEGSVIRLTAQSTERDLVIEVSDNGPGFPEEFLPRAFERFARPDAGRTRSEGGAGLGLAIVSAIARSHGGSAMARNLPAGGAAVTVTLPSTVGGRAGSDADHR